MPSIFFLHCTQTEIFISFSGIPNTLNVVSNFPFLVIGLIGLFLCYYKDYFKFRYCGSLIRANYNALNGVKAFIVRLVIIFCCFKNSLQGELWGWTCFYIGVAAVAIGSSYYHLKPNDARLVWDRLPVSLVLRWNTIVI